MGAKSIKSILSLTLALLIVLSQINLNVAFAESSGGTETLQQQQMGDAQNDETNQDTIQPATLGLSETPETPSGAPKITPFAISNYNHFFYDRNGVVINDSRVKIPPSATTNTDNTISTLVAVNDIIGAAAIQYIATNMPLSVVSLYSYKNAAIGYNSSDTPISVLSYAVKEQIAGENDIYKIDIDYMAENLSLDDGRYTLYFFNEIDTFILSFNVVRIKATINITAAKTTTTGIPVNPTALDIGHTTGSTADNAIIADIEYEWAIYNAADVTVAADGTPTVTGGSTPLNDNSTSLGKKIVDAQLDLSKVNLTNFSDGKYVLIQKPILPTIYANETGVGDRRLHLVDDITAKPFIIIHPETTINGTVGLNDNSKDPLNVITDPSAVTLTSKYTADGSEMASTVKWEIFESDGTTSAKAETTLTGKSETLDLTTQALPAGTYKIKVLEKIDATDETHETWATFTIPEQAFVDVEYYLQGAAGVMQELDKTGWPATVSGIPTAATPTSGYDYTTAGKDYELIKVTEDVGNTGIDTEVIPPPANNYQAAFPADSKTTVVKYYYKEKAKLVVEHVFYEADGTTKSPTQPMIPGPTTTGYVGDPYTTTKLPKPPTGYELIVVPADQDGKYASGTTTVTYTYKKTPEVPVAQQSKVTVVHQFEDGTVIQGPVTTTSTPGTDHKSGRLTGYTLVVVEIDDKSVGATAGVNTIYPPNGQETVIKYIYKKPVPAGHGQVVVEHVIHHSNGTTTTYLTEAPIVDSVGNPYNSVPEDIPGYTLTAVPGNQNGSIEAISKTVTYIYVPNPTAAQLVEKHILLDEFGREIGFVTGPKVSSQPGGNKYATSSTPPLGYELVKVAGDAVGFYVNGTEKQVSYFYKPVSKPTSPLLVVSTGGHRTPSSSGANRPDTSPNLKSNAQTDPKYGSSTVENVAPSEGGYVNLSPLNINDNPGTGR